jgi:hypothetical protein
MKTYNMKDGRQISEGLLYAMLGILNLLLQEDPILFYEFVMTCRDPEHVLFDPSMRDDLITRGLSDIDKPQHTFQSVVLTYVVEDDLTMRIDHPEFW